MACARVPDRGIFLAVVSAALTDVVMQDRVLLELDAHEVALVHRFAVYLEARLQPELRQGGLSIDLDYDRHGDLRKLLPARRDRDEGRRFRPNLVVHRRKADGDNLLVVEWKKHASGETLSNLRKRLQLLLGSEDKLPAYNYELGVLVNSSDDGIRRRAYQRGGPVGPCRFINGQP